MGAHCCAWSHLFSGCLGELYRCCWLLNKMLEFKKNLIFKCIIFVQQYLWISQTRPPHQLKITTTIKTPLTISRFSSSNSSEITGGFREEMGGDLEVRCDREVQMDVETNSSEIKIPVLRLVQFPFSRHLRKVHRR